MAKREVASGTPTSAIAGISHRRLARAIASAILRVPGRVGAEYTEKYTEHYSEQYTEKYTEQYTDKAFRLPGWFVRSLRPRAQGTPFRVRPASA